MSATLKLTEINGASGSHTFTQIANLNTGNVDSANLTPGSYPVKVGSNSYIKYVQPCYTGSFTLIDNLKFHKSAGAYQTQEEVKFSGNEDYATPATGDSGDSTVPTSEPASNVADFGGLTTSQRSGSIMRIQTQSGASTQLGPANQKTYTITRDEQ